MAKLQCDGHCGGGDHKGKARRVTTISDGFGTLEFNYCETAIALDRENGMRVLIHGEKEWRCTECGGHKVQGSTWVDLNTGEAVCCSPPVDNKWCPDCNADAEVVEITIGTEEDKQRA